MTPLAGLRIIDLTTVVMGPYATSVLGDLGADVVKVEAPDGDVVRRAAPSRSGEMAPLFIHANRGKRSVVLDLKNPAALRALLRLCAAADVLVHTMRPAAAARLGLAPAALAARLPGLVQVSACGYGQDGPYAARAAYDDLIQGACAIPALMAASGGDGPRYAPVNIADRAVGLHLAIAILAAVRERDRTGRGPQVEVPMFETMASLVLGDHMGGLTSSPPSGPGGYARLLAPQRRPYHTADGQICVLIYTERHWQALHAAAGEALPSDPRLATQADRVRHPGPFHAAVAAILLQRSARNWAAVLDAADIPHAPMHDLDSLLADPHLAEVGFFKAVQHPVEGEMLSMRVPSRWNGRPPAASRLAPSLGEHTEEVLRQAGLEEREIRAASTPREMPTSAATQRGSIGVRS